MRYYSYRWLIERFHYGRKSGGCRFEDSQLQSVAALQPLLEVCSQVAWRLLWISPVRHCTMVFNTVEWQALMAFITRSPIRPPTLLKAVRALAKLSANRMVNPV